MTAEVDEISSVAVNAEFQGLKLECVTKLYGSTPALVELSAEFTAGSITAVEGPNGSGKSTLLKIAGVELEPSSGRVSFQGLASTTRTQRRGSVGMLSHKLALYPELNARENLKLSAQLHALTDAQACVDDAITKMHLQEFAERPVKELSRGQQQRIALAAATLHQPRLLLLDEPSSGLDSEAKKTLVEFLRAQRERGVCTIMVTHDHSLAELVADRRITLEAGKLKESR